LTRLGLIHALFVVGFMRFAATLVFWLSHKFRKNVEPA